MWTPRMPRDYSNRGKLGGPDVGYNLNNTGALRISKKGKFYYEIMLKQVQCA